MSKKEEKAEIQEEPKDQAQETAEEVQGTAKEEDKTEEPAKDDYEAKFNEMNDKYLRLYSEFENFRRRTAKERIELIGSASQDIISSLLPCLDDFERAIKSNETSEDIDAIKEGVTLVYHKFKSTLTSKGLKSIEVNAGDEFDTDLHEAITKIPAPQDELKGKVVDIVEKGYQLNEKVIRYSKVVIGE
eukprot:gnl/MRDRNA2_/MRDRNA2_100130_c0_seq1.p2 gnl/MRDRNA2_/MRDRNA2_100130_c0~~gnl/MRDRNA2_/MRDRNA2_100130_c0_seq1.p2  ORF type:complete len:188 (-),score=23.06 gnl/MRDRNA2_/MRDRNA2_100130_c0_seq1:585-1148(-)